MTIRTQIWFKLFRKPIGICICLIVTVIVIPFQTCWSIFRYLPTKSFTGGDFVRQVSSMDEAYIAILKKTHDDLLSLWFSLICDFGSGSSCRTSSRKNSRNFYDRIYVTQVEFINWSFKIQNIFLPLPTRLSKWKEVYTSLIKRWLAHFVFSTRSGRPFFVGTLKTW